ncbi:hypothetical protein, partial [Leptospira mayottensis]
QYIRIDTKFNPGNLSVDMMNPNATRFNAEMVLGVKNYIDNLQKNVETMFAQFSNKTNEIKEEYAQNLEIEDYKKELYKENRDGYLIAFQGLQKELGYAFGQEMLGSMTYYEKGSQYNFGESGSSHIPKMATKGSVPKNGKPEYESLPTIDTTFVGERELKGTVNIKGIPVEVNYGMQHLAFTEEFDLSKLSYNFNLKGLGTGFAEQQLSVVNQKYSQYLQGVQADLEKQAKKNDEERDKKGFLFNVLSGMSGGQKPHEAIKSEVQSRVTGAIAEASGLPASFVGALVGGSNMKQAMKAYEKSVTTEAISQVTGIPAWYLNQKISEKEATHEMAKSFSYNMGRTVGVLSTGGITAFPSLALGVLKASGGGLIANAIQPGIVKQLENRVEHFNKTNALSKQVNKFADHIGKEAYENRETIDTVVTVAAVVGAVFSFGTSMAALAAYKIAEGATEGGVLGALAGAVSVAGTAASISTGGVIGFDCSYSYADGFGASVGGGYKLAEGLGIGATLSYNEQTGFGGSVGLQAGTNALSFNAGLNYSQQGGISGSAGLGLGMGKNGTTGSYASTLNLGMSYNRQDGFGTSVGISRNNNVVLPGVGATLSRSEFGGWGADVSTDQYGSYEGKGGKYGGVSGGLSWNEHTGVTLSLNSGGTNAFNYNAQSGLTSNSNFLAESAMNNALAQGVADTDEEKAYKAAKAEADSRAAQNRNNSEQGKSALDAVGYATQRREEDYSQNHGDIDNDGKNKGSGIDPTKLEINQYERFQNRDGAAENLSKKIDETYSANQGKDKKLHKEFTSEIDLRRSKISENEANMSLGDKMKLDKLKDQKAALDAEYKAINSGGGKNDKYNEILLLKIEAVNHQMNDMKAGDAFKYKGENADNRTELMGRMIELKEKEAYGTLTPNEKKDLAKVTSGLEDYRRYGQVRDLILNNKISSYDLGSSTTAAICFVNSHSNYLGADTKTNYFSQAQLGNIGMTNSDYRGMKAPSLGVGSHWSGTLNTLKNPASGEVHVTRSQVDILNRSKANNAIVFTDTTGDGNANHWQNIARGKDGQWHDLNNNRKDRTPKPMDFSKVYQIKYNDNW